MNIESFSDDNFNTVQWINNTYKKSDESNKRKFVSNLLTELHMHQQQITSSLEDTSQQVMTILPRIMKDSNNLQNEVLLLQSQMKEVQLEIEKVQSDTGNCMSNLERLDSLKEKLQIAKNGLQESDGWGKLVAELEDLYERTDLSKICEKLQCLQKSLVAQDKLPGQIDRQNQVEGFKNRLEALASPAVVQCFSTGDAEQTKKYVAIFKNMDRIPQLLQYYRTVQKTALQQHWNEIIDLSENSNRFLNDFYEFLAENYTKQSKWCIQVFGNDGINEPISILCELLATLQPSRESVILAALKRSNDKLDVLQIFSNSNIHFASLMQNQFLITIKPVLEYYEKIRSSIFDYFNTFIAQYPAIEQNYLATSLVSLNLNQSTSNETIRALGTANRKILEWAEESTIRCEKITQNLAIAPLTSVLRSIFKIFIEKYKKAQQQLSASRNIEQNWSLLQSSISLLQNIGDLANGIEKLEEKINVKILETYDKIQKINNNQVYFGYCLTEKRDINDLKKLAKKVKDDQQKKLVENDYNNFGIFSVNYEYIKPVCEEIHDATLSVIFSPIEKYLQNIEPMESFSSTGTDLPDYSYAPQEWLTQIGQYLLTLPQHLEPLLLSPSQSLKFALELSDKKYKENIPSVDVLLSLVVEESCTMYQNQILQIKSISTTAAKQLATDIEYLNNVLEELGSTATLHLQQTAILLRATPDNYLLKSSGCEPRLVTAIRQMRNIISTE